MSGEKDWVDIIAALLTPVVAGFGIWFAYQQWKINTARFNHELFDRKYVIFQATQVFILEVLTDLEAKQDLIEVLTHAERADGVRIFIGSENQLFSLSGSSSAVRSSSRCERPRTIRFFSPSSVPDHVARP